MVLMAANVEMLDLVAEEIGRTGRCSRQRDAGPVLTGKGQKRVGPVLAFDRLVD
jgi:hypothetical protein